MPSHENRLISLLPARDSELLLKTAEVVDLSVDQELFDAGQTLGHVFFLLSGAVSLLSRIEDGAIETGMVGREGMLDPSLALGVPTTSVRATVLAAGQALRIEAGRFAAVMKRSQPLRDVMHRYVHVLMAQLQTSIACTRFHTVTPRLARVLLMGHDRLGPGNIHVTHDMLSRLLGLRRAGVTRAAIELSEHKLIRYSRGSIDVLDRRGLERAACTCYFSNQSLFQTHLST